MTYFCHRYYAKEVKRVFYTELKEEQERIFKQAFVGKLIHIKDKHSETNGSQDHHQVDQSEEREALKVSIENEPLKKPDGKMAVINRFLKVPHRDWKEREEYGKSLI